MDYVVIFGILAAAALGWVLVQVSETRRQMGLDRAARLLGMNFNFGLPRELREGIDRFRSIEKAKEAGGDFQAGINTITGERRGRKLALFDYQWVTVHDCRSRGDLLWGSEREHRRTHTRSAVAAQLGVSLPPILLRPERLVDKAAALLGYEDSDFPSLPEFSRRFYVNSPDPAFARRFVTPRLAKFFLERVRCTVDVAGSWLLVTDDSVYSASRAPGLLEFASELADLVTREQSPLR
jgi:hypothetical protein